MKDRRAIPELYYDILQAIQRETDSFNAIKITAVQLLSKMSFDKIKEHIADMDDLGLVSRDPLALTNKGRSYLCDYGSIKTDLEMIKKMYNTINDNAWKEYPEKTTIPNPYANYTPEQIKDLHQTINALKAIVAELEKK